MTEMFDQILDKHKEGLAEVSELAWSSGIKYERERIMKLLTGLREAAQKDKGVTTNININALISVIKDTK
jgi:hypothetical protein